MKLEKLNPREQPLTREQMLSLQGGNALSISLTGTGYENTIIGTETALDFLDADQD